MIIGRSLFIVSFIYISNLNQIRCGCSGKVGDTENNETKESEKSKNLQTENEPIEQKPVTVSGPNVVEKEGTVNLVDTNKTNPVINDEKNVPIASIHTSTNNDEKKSNEDFIKRMVIDFRNVHCISELDYSDELLMEKLRENNFDYQLTFDSLFV